MIRRLLSLPQLLGLGRDTATPAPPPAPEWVDPYAAGEAYRARYLEHTTDEGVVARVAEIDVAARVHPDTRPLYRSIR